LLASALHSGKQGSGAEQGEGRGADGVLGVVEAKGSTRAALLESTDWADDRLLLERRLPGWVEEGLFPGGLVSLRRRESWMVSLSRAVFYKRETLILHVNVHMRCTHPKMERKLKTIQ